MADVNSVGQENFDVGSGRKQSKNGAIAYAKAQKQEKQNLTWGTFMRWLYWFKQKILI